MAAVVTRIKTFTATDLATADLVAWRKQRSQLELLRQKRLKQRRFRRSPENYLLEYEYQLQASEQIKIKIENVHIRVLRILLMYFNSLYIFMEGRKIKKSINIASQFFQSITTL